MRQVICAAIRRMLAEPAMTPAAERGQGVVEVASGAREPVLHSARLPRHDAAIDQPCSLQVAKPAAAETV